MASNTKIIIDTDMGCDDIAAICMLSLASEVTIEGITVVDGVAHLEKGVENLLRILEAIDKPNIEVAKGTASPLKGTATFPEKDREEADELKQLEYLLPEKPRLTPSPLNVVDFIQSKITNSSNKEITLVCLGPLTNIANVINKSPDILEKAKEIIMMCGAVWAEGNAPSPSNPERKVAEYNIRIDPEAARIVFDYGQRVPITMVGIDVTRNFPYQKYKALSDSR